MQWTATTQNLTALSTTSTSVLAANKNRKHLRIENRDASIVMYIKVGAAHSSTEGISLAAGAAWEPQNPPAGAIYMKSASGTPNAAITEGE